METGIVTSSSSSNSGTSGAASKELDKTAFLKLLVAQLQHQDPTSTQDPNQMVQQLTSYSQLEAAQNTNTLLQGLQAQNLGLFQAQTTNLVGKHVRVTSSSFHLEGGKGTVGIELAGAASTVSLVIKDASGKTVATLEQGTQGAGSHIVSWNGKDASGNQLADGTYTVEVVAKDADGKAVKASTSAFAQVEAVNFLNGGVYLTAAGRSFSLSDVIEISA